MVAGERDEPPTIPDYRRPDARPLKGVLLRVLIVASLARRPVTGNPRLMLPVPFGAWVFKFCAAGFHWRLSATAKQRRQISHGHRRSGMETA